MAVISHRSYRAEYEAAQRQATEFMCAWRKAVDDYGKLMDMLKEANDILRSTHAIAKREGRDTGWPTFLKRVDDVLEKQHKVLIAYYDEAENGDFLEHSNRSLREP